MLTIEPRIAILFSTHSQCFQIHFLTSVLGATPHHIPLNVGVQLRKITKYGLSTLDFMLGLPGIILDSQVIQACPAFVFIRVLTRKHVAYVCLGIIAGMHVYNNTVHLYSDVLVLEVHLVCADEHELTAMSGQVLATFHVCLSYTTSIMNHSSHVLESSCLCCAEIPTHT
jgi:hypothetical protein